jgi:hypothetical protein
LLADSIICLRCLNLKLDNNSAASDKDQKDKPVTGFMPRKLRPESVRDKRGQEAGI